MNWISIKDRLPEKGKEVLTYHGTNYELAEYRPDDNDGSWYDTYGGESIDVPSHWCEVTPPDELTNVEVIRKAEAILRKTGLTFVKVVHYGDKHDDRFVLYTEDKKSHSFPSDEVRQALRSGKLVDYVMSSL